MKLFDLLNLVGKEPVFDSSVLLSGDANPKAIRLQLSRWVKSKQVYQLRRGLYTIAPPYQKNQPHPFLVANSLQRHSYVSNQSALAFYGMIPEVVPITVSVTTGRPERVSNPLGTYEFRHIQPRLLFGYRMTNLGGQKAFLALPEKALLDLIYLYPGGQTSTFLNELRLQNLNRLDLETLHDQVHRFNTPKMWRAYESILELAKSAGQKFEDL